MAKKNPKRPKKKRAVPAEKRAGVSPVGDVTMSDLIKLGTNLSSLTPRQRENLLKRVSQRLTTQRHRQEDSLKDLIREELVKSRVEYPVMNESQFSNFQTRRALNQEWPVPNMETKAEIVATQVDIALQQDDPRASTNAFNALQKLNKRTESVEFHGPANVLNNSGSVHVGSDTNIEDISPAEYYQHVRNARGNSIADSNDDDDKSSSGPPPNSRDFFQSPPLKVVHDEEPKE